MLKIITLNYEFPPLGGGASPVSFEIAKGLSQLGHEVEVVTMGFGDLPKIEIINNIKVHRVKCWRSKKEICHPWEQITYLFASYFYVRKMLQKKQYDLCHCHFLIPTGLLARKLKKKFGLDYFVSSHGSDIPGFNQDRFKLLHKFTRPWLLKVFREAKFQTTPSFFLKDLMEDKVLKEKSNKIIVIPNGSRSLKINNISKENIIVSVGRLLKRKGFQYLIQAFNELDLNNWKLYVIGNGPYRKNLESMANNNPNIVFTGWLDNTKDRLKILYNKAKIFSLLSRSESQGIVFLEAMSTGCAILSANSTACQETVSKNTGFLVNPLDISQVKEKLKVLISDKNLLREFSENAEKEYETRYTWPLIINKYIETIQLAFK